MATYSTFGHKVKRITTDDESCFTTMITPLGVAGIELTTTPAGMHEKTAERTIQTIKSAMAWSAGGRGDDLLNRVPNIKTGPNTPYQLVMHRKPTIPQFFFGQVGLFFTRLKDSPSMHTRSEWGIFIRYEDNRHKHMRAYI
jgi:hypothetical protein